MHIEENVPLAPLTTFHIGGSARYFVRVHTIGELIESLGWARDDNVATYVLGGGSNTLVPDVGFDGLVIKIEIGGLELQKDIKKEHAVAEDDKIVVTAGAGESWDGVVAYAVERGLWGLENLSGIPGTVGGAVWGNIGAYGASVSQTLQWVEVYDKETEEVRQFDIGACAFGYRDSFFKQHAAQYVIVRAAFAQARTPRPNLSYKDLAVRFTNVQHPTLTDIREAVLAIRKEKFPDLLVEGTAGSFFKNPILSKADADALVAKYPTMPVFAVPEADGVKIPLAWLLDKVLALRGTSVGSARLFERQPLVLVVSRGASSADVVALANTVRQKVSDTFSITLEQEVQEM